MSQDTKQVKEVREGEGYPPFEGAQSIPFAERTPISIQEIERRGWPKEPNVTEAEELLYAEAAPLMRVMGGAVAEASAAYGIACKLRGEFPAHDQLPPQPFGNEKQVLDLDKTLNDLHAAYVAMRSAYRSAAKRLMLDEENMTLHRPS